MVTIAQRAGLSYTRTLIKLTIPGDPVPKARPRLSLRGGVYTPPQTRHAEARLLSHLKANYPALQPAVGQFSVSVDAYFKGAPKIDLDNVLKLVLDALNKRVWHDDVAVIQIWARKHLHSTVPRTEITVHQLHEAS